MMKSLRSAGSGATKKKNPTVDAEMNLPDAQEVPSDEEILVKGPALTAADVLERSDEVADVSASDVDLPSEVEASEDHSEDSLPMVESFQAPKDQVRRKEFLPARTTFGMWKVVLKGGGKLPQLLSGNFTSEDETLTMIAKYLRG